MDNRKIIKYLHSNILISRKLISNIDTAFVQMWLDMNPAYKYNVFSFLDNMINYSNLNNSTAQKFNYVFSYVQNKKNIYNHVQLSEALTDFYIEDKDFIHHLNQMFDILVNANIDWKLYLSSIIQPLVKILIKIKDLILALSAPASPENNLCYFWLNNYPKYKNEIEKYSLYIDDSIKNNSTLMTSLSAVHQILRKINVNHGMSKNIIEELYIHLTNNLDLVSILIYDNSITSLIEPARAWRNYYFHPNTQSKIKEYNNLKKYNINGCDLIVTSSPLETSLPALSILTNSAYIRCPNELFYINDKRESSVPPKKIDLSEEILHFFDEKLKVKKMTANVSRILSERELALISIITSHKHHFVNKLRFRCNTEKEVNELTSFFMKMNIDKEKIQAIPTYGVRIHICSFKSAKLEINSIFLIKDSLSPWRLIYINPYKKALKINIHKLFHLAEALKKLPDDITAQSLSSEEKEKIIKAINLHLTEIVSAKVIDINLYTNEKFLVSYDKNNPYVGHFFDLLPDTTDLSHKTNLEALKKKCLDNYVDIYDKNEKQLQKIIIELPNKETITGLSLFKQVKPAIEDTRDVTATSRSIINV